MTTNAEERTGKVKDDLTPEVNIRKKVKILFDGKQFMVKIPKEISKFYDMKKGDELELTVKPKGKGKGQNSFEVKR